MGRSRYSDYGDRSVQNVATVPLPVTSTQLVYKFLATSSGGINLGGATGGTTTAPLIFKYQVAAGYKFYPERLTINMPGAGVEPDKLGNSTKAANGLIFEVWDTNTTSQLLDFTDSNPITNNSQWGSLAGTDTAVQNSAGVNPDRLNIRWTLSRAGAVPVLSSGQSFRVRVQDDLSDNDELRCMIQGVILKTS